MTRDEGIWTASGIVVTRGCSYLQLIPAAAPLTNSGDSGIEDG